MKTTKNQMAAAMIGLLGAVAFGSCAQAEQKFQKLTGAQIQAKFAGMELTDEAHWGEVLERNGTLAITSMGHKSIGKWRGQENKLFLRTGEKKRGGCLVGMLSRTKIVLRKQEQRVDVEVGLLKPNPH